MDSSDDHVLGGAAAIREAGVRVGLTGAPDERRTVPGLSLRDHAQYVSLTMEFRCNLKCVHCMIEGTMDHLQPTSDAVLDRVCAEQREFDRWAGLVLTGSEITLRPDLDRIARRAKDAGFRHIRIQTHGMKLARAAYVDQLVDAGIDEFFVSVAGCDRESHDRITGVAGAWDRMMRGLELLDQHDHVRILTNTVVTTESYRMLPEVVKALAHLRRLVQMEFWVYFPMAEQDTKGLLARHGNVRPYLLSAIQACRSAGRFVEVKNFPECMLGELSDALVNAQPTLVIDPTFWNEFDRNEFQLCPYRAQCASTECLGLTRAYLDLYGDDRDVLAPLGQGDREDNPDHGG